MTKAECVIEDLGFVRDRSKDYSLPKHDGSFYPVRVFEHGIWTIHCDSYYGRSNVYKNGILLGDYEHRYENIAGLVGAKS